MAQCGLSMKKDKKSFLMCSQFSGAVFGICWKVDDKRLEASFSHLARSFRTQQLPAEDAF